MKDFNDYMVANISEEDIQSISKLEQSIKEKEKKDIVLIAYQPSNSSSAK